VRAGQCFPGYNSRARWQLERTARAFKLSGHPRRRPRSQPERRDDGRAGPRFGKQVGGQRYGGLTWIVIRLYDSSCARWWSAHCGHCRHRRQRSKKPMIRSPRPVLYLFNIRPLTGSAVVNLPRHSPRRWLSTTEKSQPSRHVTMNQRSRTRCWHSSEPVSGCIEFNEPSVISCRQSAIHNCKRSTRNSHRAFRCTSMIFT